MVGDIIADSRATSPGIRSQYAAQEPLTAMLVAGAIGFALGYLIHRR
jgi:ElaB/YqjD/DUF883 family membrane-anchored ribosome-binding protein